MSAHNDIKSLILECHQIAKEHGWWESVNIPEKLALIHSEVSEALEDYRSGADVGVLCVDLETKKPMGFPSELADIVIRVFDLAGFLSIDLAHVIEQKMEFNKSRPYRHGGKRA